MSIGYYPLIKLKYWIYKTIGIADTSNCIVLYYHSVRNEDQHKFAKQMELLLKYTTPIRADEITHKSSGNTYSVVTFDDALTSILYNATPELIKRKIPFIVFVPVDYLGKVPDWDTSTTSIQQKEYVMSADQLKQLPRDLATIGSHTLSHSNLLKITKGIAKYEIQESKDQLETILENRVELFSFPFGIYDEELIHMVIEAGYEKIFTIQPELSKMTNNSKVFGRVIASPKDWEIEYSLKIQGAYGWLPLAISVKRIIASLFTN
jgi:peptidoglycan/xylan/chitin deacetylase (PgdA/CDA1 family)